MHFHSVKPFVLLCGFVLSQSQEGPHDHFARHLDTSRHSPRVTSVQADIPSPPVEAFQPVPSGSFAASREMKKALSRSDKRCPLPATACPILSSNLSKKLMARKYAHKDQTLALPWECVNLLEELTACGTCHNNVSLIPFLFVLSSLRSQESMLIGISFGAPRSV